MTAANLAMKVAEFFSGTSFVLVTSHEARSVKGGDYSFSIHPRFEQPCYGELRKYRNTHKDYTQDYPPSKPFDLYDPFPDGKPCGLALPFYVYDQEGFDVLLRDILDPSISPWARGLPSKSNIKMMQKNGRAFGFYLDRLNIDPTILVSLCWFLRSRNRQTNYKILLDIGATPLEAFLLLHQGQGNVNLIYMPDGYNFGRVNLQRFLSRNPVDYTGGTLEDRFDYDRKNIQDLFFDIKNKDEKVFDFSRMTRYGKVSKWGEEVIDPKEYLNGLRELIKEDEISSITSVIHDTKLTMAPHIQALGAAVADMKQHSKKATKYA